MVATQKRKRAIVSYREPSSDEDLGESASEAQSSRTRNRNKRARPSTRNRSPSPRAKPTPPQARCRNAQTSEGSTAGKRTGRALRQSKQRAVSYKDISSDEDDDFEVEQEEVVERRQPRRPTAQPNKAHRSTQSKKTVTPRKSLGAPLKPNKAPKPTPSVVQIPTDGIIPDWASLPYHVLLQIFVHASYPLHDDNMAPSTAISWLLMAARLCKAFTKPALNALYRIPPIHATKQTQLLVQRLITPATDTYINHQVLVKRLDLDATRLASATDPLNDNANLSTLIGALTTLREIDIFDPLDRPPYRQLVRRVRRWYYPDELFAALRQNALLLQSWQWNSHHCPQGPSWMKERHLDKAFQSLRELTLTKFDLDPKKLDDGTPTTEELIGSAIAALPNLTSLTFESCKALNKRLLALLPSSLVFLSITNCINVVSDDLQEFLAGHGRRLEELVLYHNQCLSLSFMADLKSSCPRLEVFRVDLNYYSSLIMSADNEPLYDSLLEENEIPTWPSTLRIVELEYMRNWSSDAATNFFHSLVNAAGDLPQLRVLRLTAMVDIDWRQRATYRRKWASWFEHVFASRAANPSSHLASLRAYREWKALQNENTERNDSLLDITDGVQKVDGHESDDLQSNNEQRNEVESDSDAPLLSRGKQKPGEKWNSRRLRTRGKTPTNYDESSGAEDEANDDSGAEESEDAEEKPEVIQGRCHTVLFRIDNSRPREEVYDEGDFLDDEPSGDEDWNGNDDVDDAYAW